MINFIILKRSFLVILTLATIGVVYHYVFIALRPAIPPPAAPAATSTPATAAPVAFQPSASAEDYSVTYINCTGPHEEDCSGYSYPVKPVAPLIENRDIRTNSGQD